MGLRKSDPYSIEKQYILASSFWLKNATVCSEMNFSNFNRKLSPLPEVVLNTVGFIGLTSMNDFPFCVAELFVYKSKSLIN